MPLIYDVDTGYVAGWNCAVPNGARRRFAYPKEFVTMTDYGAHRGAVVTVLRPLRIDDECDLDQGPMYLIRADDGWEGWADEEEIKTPA
jgi:hypothetical protein